MRLHNSTWVLLPSTYIGPRYSFLPHVTSGGRWHVYLPICCRREFQQLLVEKEAIMTHRRDVNCELYNAYLSNDQVEQLQPKNVYYTTEFDAKCGRYYCAVCGECHPANASASTRLAEYVTGITFPDAAFRASEAYLINDYVQRRFREERQKLRGCYNSKMAQPFPFSTPQPHN